MKKVVKHLESTNPSRVDDFKKECAAAVKKVSYCLVPRVSWEHWEGYNSHYVCVSPITLITEC